MSVNCIVVVREVWDTRDLVGDVLDGSGNISGLDTRFEPEDLNALEAALRLKEDQGGTVTAVSVGASKSVDVLRESLYRGVDKVMRIEADLERLDTQAMAALLSDTINGLGEYDLILTGTTVVDGSNSLPGAHLAALLDLDHISWVDAIESCADGKAVGKRAVEMGYEYVEVPLPAVMSMGVALLEDDPRAPRSAKAMLKLKMKKAEIPTADGANAAAQKTTETAGFAAVEQRVIESREIDSEDEAALADMLQEVTKGE